jgi:hypothetical protein
MTSDELAAVLAGMPGATVGEPFDEGVPVYKVAGKVARRPPVARDARRR